MESTFRILVADVKASALSSAASSMMAERKKIGEEFIDFFIVLILTIYFVCVVCWIMFYRGGCARDRTNDVESDVIASNVV